jgi:hypothetical protein
MPERRFEHVDELKALNLSKPDDQTMHYLWQIVDEGVLGASKHVSLGNELLLHILETVADSNEALRRARLAASFISRTRGQDTPVIGNCLSLLLADLDKIEPEVLASRRWWRRPSGISPARAASWHSTIQARSPQSS